MLTCTISITVAQKCLKLILKEVYTTALILVLKPLGVSVIPTGFCSSQPHSHCSRLYDAIFSVLGGQISLCSIGRERDSVGRDSDRQQREILHELFTPVWRQRVNQSRARGNKCTCACVKCVCLWCCEAERLSGGGVLSFTQSVSKRENRKSEDDMFPFLAHQVAHEYSSAVVLQLSAVV